ncbi:unnamed protein product [Macrosiphum euphorbiae]|uniref:Uncharacterized protein n=1 Tax=Macrosiphum euphorbiae TaxID=13131 RepID=A0AAV0VNW1_9HEMI|nr:unnamed protein product [Macrosiphum euphorbiae]
MERKTDFASLLKSTQNLKHSIDELVCKNHKDIDIQDIECMRKLIEHMIKEYSSNAKCNNDQRLISNCSNFCEINEKIQSKVRHKLN